MVLLVQFQQKLELNQQNHKKLRFGRTRSLPPPESGFPVLNSEFPLPRRISEACSPSYAKDRLCQGWSLSYVGTLGKPEARVRD